MYSQIERRLPRRGFVSVPAVPFVPGFFADDDARFDERPCAVSVARIRGYLASLAARRRLN